MYCLSNTAFCGYFEHTQDFNLNFKIKIILKNIKKRISSVLAINFWMFEQKNLKHLLEIKMLHKILK